MLRFNKANNENKGKHPDNSTIPTTYIYIYSIIKIYGQEQYATTLLAVRILFFCSLFRPHFSVPTFPVSRVTKKG